MTKPTHLRGRKPVRIKLHDIVDVLAMIDAHDQQAHFKTEAAAADAYVTVHPKTVNFVKDFVAAHPVMKTHPLAARLVPSECADPSECGLNKA